MKLVTAGLAARTATNVRGSSTRHTFALGGAALALACGVVASGVARVLGAPSELAVVATVAVALTLTGYLMGRRFDRLTRRAKEDPVTRLGTRRHWEEQLSVEVARAARSRMPLSLMVLDVDHLKTLNDTHGHATGDLALTLVGQVLLDTCRARDVPARIGGDELAVLLPRTRAREACVLADRVRAELASRRRAVGAPLARDLTISIGVAELAGAASDARRFLDAADAALYAAKRAGRDRVEVAGTPDRSARVIPLAAHRRAAKRGHGARDRSSRAQKNGDIA